jgi:branched-subunit amino acid transport protein
MKAMLVILAVGIGTYISRAAFVVGLANRRIPPLMLRSLEFVGPAVMGALVVSLLLDPTGRLAVGPPEAAGLVAGGVTVYFKRSFPLAAIAGMTAFWVVRAIL